MADALQITSNASELLRHFDRLLPSVQTGVRKGLARALLLVEDRVRTKTGVKARRGGAGLMGRLTSHVVEDSRGIDGVIGFRKTRGFPYELAQEFGAKAKPGKAMAIPVTPKARRYKSPRDYPGTLFIPRGRHVLSESISRYILETQYVLVKSIRPRLHFRQTVLGSAAMISDQVERGARDAYKEV